ncbi:unnamed protein product, partial [Polarella glacialis]
ATYAIVRVLSDLAAQQGAGSREKELASRWERRLARMCASAVPLFYHGGGLLRAVATLRSSRTDSARFPNNSQTDMTTVPAFLDDAYEGELMVLFVDLLANWTGYPENGAAEKFAIWEKKQSRVKAVNYTTPDGTNLTVQEGFWFSSHEQWKLMVLPYLNLPLVREVFTNVEHVRLLDAIQRRVPGLFASSLGPPNVRCGKMGGYCNAVGVQKVASQPVQWDQCVSPYGAYPSILIDRGAGLAWYNTMLSLPHMQTLTGSVESSDVAGTSVATVQTWDTKTTTVLAMLGGSGPMLRKFLARDGLLVRFELVVGRMYAASFPMDMARAGRADARLPLPPHGLLPPHWEEHRSEYSSCGCNATAAANMLGVAVTVPDAHVPSSAIPSQYPCWVGAIIWLFLVCFQQQC